MLRSNFLAAGAAMLVFLCCPTLQREVDRFPRQPGRPGPMPMGPGGPGGPGGPKPPPPVDASFAGNCTQQQALSPHTRCEQSGSFSAIQCMGAKCFCVDPNTGEKINTKTFPMHDRATVNCSAELPCPSMECVKNCRDGYRLDSRECQLCECNVPPPSQRCSTIKEVVREDTCSCNCVKDSGGPSVGPTMRRRMAMMSGGSCPSCNTTCNATQPTQDVSCAVASEEDCGTGTSLKSVGPRGRTECVEDLDVDDKCVPEEGSSPLPRPGPRPAGADKRRNVGRVGSAPPPCSTGLVCREVRYKEYLCTEAPTDGPCVRDREADPLLECDAEGFFKPVQCRTIPVTTELATAATTTVDTTSTDTTTATTTVAATTEPPVTTPPAFTTPPTTPPATPPPTPPPTAAARMVFPADEAQLCHCVEPDDGDKVQGSEVRVEGRRSESLCNKVLRECNVSGVDRFVRQHNHKPYHIPHGQDYFDAANCRACECKNGNATAFCSAPGNCTAVTVERQGTNCTLEGGEGIPHAETRMVGCERCACRNGKLRCTKKKRGCRPPPPPPSREGTPQPPTTPAPPATLASGQQPSRDEDPCDGCRALPPGPMCGPDGRNHVSRCTAVHCAGIPSLDLQEGPCQSQDACEAHPCPGEMVCVNKKGTKACLGHRGCPTKHLRTCVDVNRLSCPVFDESETTPTTSESFEESSVICGSDGETYRSLCHLLQTTNNVRVAHAGSCTSAECQGGEVCGSDGVTYSNLCELQHQASVRADYSGACIANASSLEELCQQVSSEGRCVVNEGNCNHLVFPEDGCCPVCGGSVQIVVDIDAITDASETNPDLQVVDSFTLQLLQVDELANISDSCAIEVGVTETGAVQLVFRSLSEEDTEFCFQASKRVEAYINGGVETTSDGGTRTTEVRVSLPQAYSFAMTSLAADVVQEEGEVGVVTTVRGGTGGARGQHHDYPLMWPAIITVFLGVVF